MANTNRISNAKTKSLPYFPELSVGKTRRVMTKHFCNLSLWLNEDQLAILSFLIYQSHADNTFKYSTSLLTQFQHAYFAARIQYSTPNRRPSIQFLRLQIESLIYKGLLLQTGVKNKLMVSPMLTYNVDVVNNKRYKEITEMYQKLSPDSAMEITDRFSKLVASYLESKKPNYKYGKQR